MTGKRFEISIPEGTSEELVNGFKMAAKEMGANIKAIANRLECPLYIKRDIVIGVLQLDNHTHEEKAAILKKSGFQITQEDFVALLIHLDQSTKISPVDWFEVFYAPRSVTSKQLREHDHLFYGALATHVSRQKKALQAVPESVLAFFGTAFPAQPVPHP